MLPESWSKKEETYSNKKTITSITAPVNLIKMTLSVAIRSWLQRLLWKVNAWIGFVKLICKRVSHDRFDNKQNWLSPLFLQNLVLQKNLHHL